MAAMVLKGLEDKTFRGASIASPSSPWGGGPNANEADSQRLSRVSGRAIFITLRRLSTPLAIAPPRIVCSTICFSVQQKPDGSFPQNSWVDGRPIGNGLQMDQVALPLVLAYQLERTTIESLAQTHKTCG